MGAIRDFLFPQVQTAKPTKVSDVEAALTPIQISDSVYNILGGATNTTRQLAMSVPSVARADAIAPQIVVLLTFLPITQPPSPKGNLTADRHCLVSSSCPE